MEDKMKKSFVFEALLYITIIIFAIIMLIRYEPRNMEYEIPKAFEVIESGDLD